MTNLNKKITRIFKMKNLFTKNYWAMKGLALLVLVVMGLRGDVMGQNSNATWGNNASTAWYTVGNWSPNTAYPGVQGAATSNTNIATWSSNGTGNPFGINMGTASLNLGAISIENTRTTAVNITNSSGTAGVLRLYGATINSVANTIVRNNGSGLLTLQTANTMGLVLSNGTENIIQIDNTGGITVASIISGSNNLTKAGSGTGVLTLSGVNTYSGNTTISAGTLALSGSGSIANSPNIIIGSGGTFNVSTLTTPLTLVSTQTLKSSSIGSNTTATITVASSKNLTLSSGGLTFTAYGGGATSPLTVTGASAGALALNSAPITVTTSTALAVGTYKLIAKSGSATGVSGTIGTLTINGSGLAANTTGALSISSGELILTVSSSTSPQQLPTPHLQQILHQHLQP